MAGVELRDFQKDCVAQLRSGKVLAAGVGAGKSVMALYWYVSTQCRTRRSRNQVGELFRILKGSPDLVVITTAKKRDSGEWSEEFARFALKEGVNHGMGGVTVTVDSWNNIGKYVDADRNTVFIFDEQRAIGHGAWSKAFVRIARSHPWIMLSATPADDWKDWCPVMVADGFYRNRTDFFRRHAIYSRYTTYPKITSWYDTHQLEVVRDRILVTCEVPRQTERHDIELGTGYNKTAVKTMMKERVDPETGEPFMNASQLCYAIRKVVNCDPSRMDMARDVFEDHGRVIVFYSLRAELELIHMAAGMAGISEVGAYNGSTHDEVPTGNRWVYAVQYNAGAEGWNCTTCNTILFWDLPYSYRQLEQAKGRIDRLNTPYRNLFYYSMTSNAKIDLAIKRALRLKKDFNAAAFMKGLK